MPPRRRGLAEDGTRRLPLWSALHGKPDRLQGPWRICPPVLCVNWYGHDAVTHWSRQSAGKCAATRRTAIAQHPRWGGMSGRGGGARPKCAQAWSIAPTTEGGQGGELWLWWGGRRGPHMQRSAQGVVWGKPSGRAHYHQIVALKPDFGREKGAIPQLRVSANLADEGQDVRCEGHRSAVCLPPFLRRLRLLRAPLLPSAGTRMHV